MTPVAITGSPEARHSQNPDPGLIETRTQPAPTVRPEDNGLESKGIQMDGRDIERLEAERKEAQRLEERRAQGPALHPVILMGGSGTRLWPLSRNAVPKQLLALTSQRSMLQETLLRLNGIEHLARPVIVCNQEHRFMVAEQLRQIGVEAEDIILEPVGRNTAAAVAVAALRLQQVSPDSLMLVLPADHVIANVEAFHTAVAQARRCAQQGCMATFGVVPGKPETGYGYIQHGEQLRRPDQAGGGGYAAGVCAVQRFVEKPDAQTAQHYVESGEYSWNSGMFLFTAACFIEELDKCAPEVAHVCRAVVENSHRDLDFFRLNKELFASCPSISVDNAVMEKTRCGVMVPVDIGWNDVGSWSALWEFHEKDNGGNVTRGEVLLHDVQNSYINAERRLVAAVGVDNLVIVETPDAILVANKDRAQDVKKIVERLQKEGRTEHETHRKVYRPWGSYESMDNGQRFQVKRLTVSPQAVLSLQMHHHRSEHWVVVSGTAEVTINGEARLVTENQSVYIPLGAWHRVRNPGHIPLHMIEVQSGPYLGEDDIVRTEDTYGRIEEDASTRNGHK